MRRVDIGDITINNYYVCEIHFPNQILDYATRKILIKTAKPLTIAELSALPSHHKTSHKSRRHSDDYDAHIEQEYDDDEGYELEDSKGICGFICCHCFPKIHLVLKFNGIIESIFIFRVFLKMTSNLVISV